MANEIVQVEANKMAESIRLLGEEIGLSKISFNELRDRGFWERAFSNNTKDLAGGLARQAESINTLLRIVQRVILLNVGNTAYLKKVSELIKFTEDGHLRHLSEYEKLSVDIIDAAVDQAHRVEEGFKENVDAIDNIHTLLKDINEWAKWIEEVVKTEQSQTKAQYEQLSQGAEATRSELKNIKAEQSKSEAQYKQISQGAEAARNELESIKTEQSQSKAQYEQLSQGAEATRSELESIKTEQTRSKAQYEQLSQGAEATRSELKNIKAEQSKSEAQYKQLRQGSEAARNELESIKTEQSQSKTQYEQLSQGAESTRSELKNIKAEQSKSEAQYKQLSQGSEAARNELESIKTEQSQSKAQYEKLSQGAEATRSEFKNIKAEQAKSEMQYKQLSEAMLLELGVIRSNIQISLDAQQQLHQKRMVRMVVAVCVLALSQLGLIGYLVVVVK